MCSSSSSLGAHFICVPRSVNTYRVVACFCNMLSRHIQHKTVVSMGVYIDKEPLHVHTVYFSGFLHCILRATYFEQFSGYFTEFRAHASTVVPRPFFLQPGYEATLDGTMISMQYSYPQTIDSYISERNKHVGMGL